MWRIRLQFLALVIVAASCGGGGGTARGSSGATANLQWEAPGDPRVKGYRVYIGTGSGAYDQPRGAGLDAGEGTTFVAVNLQGGRTYYFAVTAYDSAGNESDYSNEAIKEAR